MKWEPSTVELLEPEIPRIKQLKYVSKVLLSIIRLAL